MFSPASVCLSVCLLTGLFKNYRLNLYEIFYGMVGHNPGTNRDQTVKLILCLRIVPFKIVVKRTMTKLYNLAFSVL